MHRQLVDSDYAQLRKRLLVKGSAEQREFVGLLRDSRRFCEWFRARVGSEGDEPVPDFPRRLTESEYKDPPRDTERELHDLWRGLTPAVACRPTFWGEVTLRQIEAGVIESGYLAANEGNVTGGDRRLAQALGNNGDEKALDSCVRAALRRFSGLPEARGNRSVYVNCPLSRAWWRMRLCESVSEHTPAPGEQVLKVFRISLQYWENLILLMVSRNSVLGDRNARDVLVWSLSERLAEDKGSGLFKAGSLDRLCRALGVRAAWQEFGALEKAEMKTLIDAEIGLRW